MKNELIKREIQVQLKKKAFLGDKELGTQTIKLAELALKSVLQTKVNFGAVPLDVQITIHKATRQVEQERVAGKKWVVKYIPAPFKTLEE